MDRAREAEIQSCFNCQTEFYYPKNREAFDNLLEDFKIKSNISADDTTTAQNDSYSDTDSIVKDNFGLKHKKRPPYCYGRRFRFGLQFTKVC